MAQLWPVEADDPEVGGFIVTMPSGRSKVIAWRSAVPISPTLEAAKKYAAEVITSLQSSGQHRDVEATNWASFAAAVQRLIDEWNDKLRAHLYRQPNG
jgi:hypothetical protein